MGGGRVPGPIGVETEPGPGAFNPGAPGAGFDSPGLVKADAGPIVASVVTDWSPPNPSTTPAIVVRGKALAQLESQLDALPEWGRGGGSLRADRLDNVRTAEVVVHLHANLQLVLPRWDGRDAASTQARAEWDRMVGKLRIHEQRHVDIAIEEANALAAALERQPMSKIAALVTSANQTMAQRQQELDDATDHGSKAGVAYGDVILDTSIP
jgi:hypothetical protein